MVRVHSIGVMSCAKLCAVVQGAVGAIVGIIFLVIGMLGSAISPFGTKIGVMGSIIGGAIGSAIYNWAAQAMGGLELELVSVGPPQAQPPSTYSAGA
jgi:uncharacterized membrane protein YeaQ/YmgE (transglycosylase-associated protein family)